MSSIRERTRLFQAAWGAFVASGAVWCLLRLLLGVWGVRDSRRRSTSIDDPDVLAEVESFRLALFDRESSRGPRALVIDGFNGGRGRLAASFHLASARLALLEPASSAARFWLTKWPTLVVLIMCRGSWPRSGWWFNSTTRWFTGW